MLNLNQERTLAVLREKIRDYIGGKRLSHTLAVEREIRILAEIYAPEEEFRLRAAALLHDVTKECSLERQQALCREFGIAYTDEELRMPKTFHAKTAAALVLRDFPDAADDYVASCIRWHTTGRAGMTVGEKLLYLADWIEDTRTFEDCRHLRESFYSGLKKADTPDKKARLLRGTLILSFDLTIRNLLADGDPVHMDTVAARNALICNSEVRE